MRAVRMKTNPSKPNFGLVIGQILNVIDGFQKKDHWHKIRGVYQKNCIDQ